MKINRKKYICLYIISFLLLIVIVKVSIGFTQYQFSKSMINKYEPLLGYLETKGFNRDDLKRIFSDPRIEIYPEIAVVGFTPPTISDTSEFIQEKINLYSTQRFMKKYKYYLDLAEKKYGVEKEAIVSILMIETSLGNDIGNHSVFNVLSSMALSNEEKSKKAIVKYVNSPRRINNNPHSLSPKQKAQLIDKFHARAIRRSEWAKEELAVLIYLHLNNNLDILSLVGSHAGAFGYPQFIPSSAQKYGIDANNDGMVDLYNFPDAIMSVANFLQKKGWDSDKDNKKNALRCYNNNSNYVNSILSTADSIKNQVLLAANIDQTAER